MLSDVFEKLTRYVRQPCDFMFVLLCVFRLWLRPFRKPFQTQNTMTCLFEDDFGVLVCWNESLCSFRSLPVGDYLLGHAPGNTHFHIQKNVSAPA